MTTIARCPQHGLHGAREDCFECGGPVEQVEAVLLPTGDGLTAALAVRRDHAIAATTLRRRCTLQEAADLVGDMMKAADEAVKLAIHGPGPTVAGPSGGPDIER